MKSLNLVFHPLSFFCILFLQFFCKKKGFTKEILHKPLIINVGPPGFEPGTPWLWAIKICFLPFSFLFFLFDIQSLTSFFLFFLFPCFASFCHSFCNFFANGLTNILQMKKGSDKSYSYPNPSSLIHRYYYGKTWFILWIIESSNWAN